MPTLIKFGQLNPRWVIGSGLGIVASALTGLVVLFSGQNAAGITTYKELSDGSREQSGSFLAASGVTALHWDGATNRLGVGKRNPKATVDALGTISGKLLTLSSLQNCTLKTSATGNVLCGTDNTGGSSVTAGQGLGLNGAVFTLNGTITGSLVRFTTVSGSLVKANSILASSGALVWEGAASGATLYLGGKLEGAGLVDCDLATQTLAWDVTTGRFSCGTDSDTQWSNTGALTSAFDARYVNTFGDTMTGALVVDITGGNINTIGLILINTLSGAILQATQQLRSSGSLVTESGAIFDAGTLYVNAGTNSVGIGTTSPKTALEVLGTISGSLITQNGAGTNYFRGNVVIGPATAAGGIFHVSTDITANAVFSRSSDNAGGFNYMFRKSRGTTNAPSAVIVGDVASNLLFQMYNDAWRTVGNISMEADNGFGATGTDSPGRMMFYTTPDGAAVQVERMRITSTGSIGIGTTTPTSLLHINSLAGSNPNFYRGDTDLAHGMTVLAPTSVLHAFTSYSGSAGGAVEQGFSSATNVPGLTFWGTVGGATSPTAPAVLIVGAKKNGTTDQRMTATGLVLQVSNNRFSEGNTNPLMTILGDGKVGIGITAPKTALDVLGTISGSSITQNSNGLSYFRGRLGVGTSNPSTAAVIHAYSSGAGITNKLLMEDTTSAVYVLAKNTAAPLGFRMGLQGNGASQFGTLDNLALNFITNSAGAATILGNGNMGIGNGLTTPGSKLSVSGAVVISNNGNLGASAAKAMLDVKGTISGTTIFASKTLSSSGLLVVESLFKVGSGAATVMASAEYQSGSYVTSSGAGVMVLDSYGAGIRHLTPHILFGYRGNFDTNLYRVGSGSLRSDGQLALGSLPLIGGSSNALCVGANNRIEQNTSTSCLLSSLRFKHDVKDFDGSALELLSKIIPVLYKQNGTGTEDYGLIAEEIEKIDPRLVFYEQDGLTVRGVKYEHFVSILIKAIQELKEKNDTLESRIRDIEKVLEIKQKPATITPRTSINDTLLLTP